MDDERKKEIAQSMVHMKPNRLTHNLPPYLKNPDNFERIMKEILEAGRTSHSHGDIEAWSKCVKCQSALWKRKEMMYGLGFKTAAQYTEWKKIHEEIRSRRKLGLLPEV